MNWTDLQKYTTICSADGIIHLPSLEVAPCFDTVNEECPRDVCASGSVDITSATGYIMTTVPDPSDLSKYILGALHDHREVVL